MTRTLFDCLYGRLFDEKRRYDGRQMERLMRPPTPEAHKHEILEIEKRIDAKIAEAKPELERLFARTTAHAEARDKRFAEQKKAFDRHASMVLAALRDAGRGATAAVIRREIWPDAPWVGDRRS